MHTIELDSTGTPLSAIGFGGMHLSIQGRPDEEQSRRVLNASLDEGVTFIDTADCYCLSDQDIGHNERLIASVLAGRADRERIHIGTKGGLKRPKGAWTRDGSPRHLRKACEQSLSALGVDQIFLYQLHSVDEDVPVEESVGTLAELKREGKVKHVGLSNVSIDQIRQAMRIVTIASVQNRLSPFFREAVENGVVSFCAGEKITFFAYSPVGGGRLAKKIPRYLLLQRMAKEHGTSPYGVVLAWVRAQGKTVVPIPSATRIESAVDSARSAAVELTADEIAEIDGIEFSTR